MCQRSCRNDRTAWSVSYETAEDERNQILIGLRAPRQRVHADETLHARWR